MRKRISRLLLGIVGVALLVSPQPAVEAETVIDVCELATEADIEGYRGLDVTTESLLTQGNANSLREKGAGGARVWTCNYDFVNPPPDVFGRGLSLSVFTDDMPDVPVSEIYGPPGDYIVVLPIGVGDEGYWMYDDDSVRGGIAPLVNPLWARVGECWFEFTGSLGAEHPEDGQARGLLTVARQVGDRLRDTDCEVTAELDARGVERVPFDDPRGDPATGGGSDPDPGSDRGSEPSDGSSAGPQPGGVVAGPPTLLRARAFQDLRTPGTVDTGDLIFFIFSEAMDVGIDSASTLVVLDENGTLADLDCGNGTIDCTFIAEGDAVDGIDLGVAQGIGMVILGPSEESRTHETGEQLGLQYPLTVISASAEYTDQEGLGLDVVAGDRVVENDGADTGEGATPQSSSMVPVALVVGGLAVLGGGALAYRRARLRG